MKNEKDLVGFPDIKLLAEDMAEQGHYSCEEAEAAGWLVTDHEDTRNAVNDVLDQMLVNRIFPGKFK